MEILAAFFIIEITMLIAWSIYYLTKNPGIVDVFWPIGFMVVSLFYLYPINENLTLNIIVSALLLLWGLRLAGFLYWTRIRNHEIDPRYTHISSGWKNTHIGFLINYLFQGVLIFLISLPVYFISIYSGPIRSWQWLGIAIVIISIFFETRADITLNNFKKSKVGGICQVGWWKYSRHPNYFFEWLTWLGMSLIALYGGVSLLALLSPITLLLVMLLVTGPITEAQSLKKRGELYKKYQQTTSYFIPLPRKQ